MAVAEEEQEEQEASPLIPPARQPAHLALRVVSALILIPIALGTVMLGGLWLAVFLALVGIAMTAEWGMLVGASGRVLMLYIAVNLLIALGFCAFAASGQSLMPWLLAILLLSVMFAGLAFLGRIALPGWLGLGLVYCWVPVLALAWLRSTDIGLWLVAWMLLVVWGTDIGGYFVGRAVGGAKLVPQISPNKTWSGLFGGMALAVIAGTTAVLWFELGNVLSMAVAAACLAVIGQAGDIAESAIKRRFGVKDSGRLIPGHGGILDRVDALVFVAPVVAASVFLLES